MNYSFKLNPVILNRPVFVLEVRGGQQNPTTFHTADYVLGSENLMNIAKYIL